MFCKDLSWVHFFVIFVNDLPAKIDQCSVSLYADECPYRTGEKCRLYWKSTAVCTGELLHIYAPSLAWMLNIGKLGVLTVSIYNALIWSFTESLLSSMGLTYGTNFPGLSCQSGLKKHLGRLFGSTCSILHKIYFCFAVLFFVSHPVLSYVLELVLCKLA